MSMKKTFGLYLAYPPTIRLTNEGLGRFLAEFLRAAGERDDTRFVVACPGWMRESLSALFDHAGIPEDAVELLSPPGKPGLLILSDLLEKKPKAAKEDRPVSSRRTRRLSRRIRAMMPIGLAARCRSPVLVALVVIALLPLVIAGMVAATTVRSVGRGLRGLKRAMRLGGKRIVPGLRIGRYRERFARLRHSQTILESEMQLVHDMISRRHDVAAWYCPTAFWPGFNTIDRPRLMCVPDFVVADFPVDFARIGGDAFLETVLRIERTIRGGDRFVTYSEQVKQATLVERFGIEAARVSVVHHGANRLDHVLAGAADDGGDGDGETVCRRLLGAAVARLEPIGPKRPIVGEHGPGPFIFYASQIRPNKNVVTLVRAFHHLVRRRFIGRRLILTGSPSVMPEIGSLIAALGLENDVLFLRGLSEEELAACYRMADLSVNPSLSEGGCPFTFTESLSVGTPVVMARIPVTEEIIVDEPLRRAMLFDPYDRSDMASRIEWALDHREELLGLQRPVYERLASRSWREVVDEHVDILDAMSSNSVPAVTMQPRQRQAS